VPQNTTVNISKAWLSNLEFVYYPTMDKRRGLHWGNQVPSKDMLVKSKAIESVPMHCGGIRSVLSMNYVFFRWIMSNRNGECDEAGFLR
jgi:hypothetical protein